MSDHFTDSHTEASNIPGSGLVTPAVQAGSSAMATSTRINCPVGKYCRAIIWDDHTAMEHVVSCHPAILKACEGFMSAIDHPHRHICGLCVYVDTKLGLIRHLREAHNIPETKLAKCPFCNVKVHRFRWHVQTDYADKHRMVCHFENVCKSAAQDDKSMSIRCLFCHKEYMKTSIRGHLYRQHTDQFVQGVGNGNLPPVTAPVAPQPIAPPQNATGLITFQHQQNQGQRAGVERAGVEHHQHGHRTQPHRLNNHQHVAAGPSFTREQANRAPGYEGHGHDQHGLHNPVDQSSIPGSQRGLQDALKITINEAGQHYGVPGNANQRSYHVPGYALDFDGIHPERFDQDTAAAVPCPEAPVSAHNRRPLQAARIDFQREILGQTIRSLEASQQVEPDLGLGQGSVIMDANIGDDEVDWDMYLNMDMMD
ncbi:hypothetical protein CONLIGDRAFT_687568 [Coniochaeta ligniaria NRRL 30616]|uniref:Uncharacterized protein n=1 Tax=Coniochaeta ligniaria NRRL 30616 TaxID=1408157 RepID=A0A1J7IZY7_9PEZI|nr:hypothetical protein CONLIGDRAFT_687568 [Coniochaeta ligniaria NRRL 30616]